MREGKCLSVWLCVPLNMHIFIYVYIFLNMYIYILSNKNLNSYSTSLVAREMQVSTASHPLRMAIINKMDKNKCC